MKFFIEAILIPSIIGAITGIFFMSFFKIIELDKRIRNIENFAAIYSKANELKLTDKKDSAGIGTTLPVKKWIKSSYAPKDKTGFHDRSTAEIPLASGGWTDWENPVAKLNVVIGMNAGITMMEKGGTHNIYLGPFVDGGTEKEDYVLRIGSFSRKMKENEVLVHKLTKQEWATMYMAIKGLIPEGEK